MKERSCYFLFLLLFLQACSISGPKMPSLRKFRAVGPEKSQMKMNELLVKRGEFRAMQSSIKLEARKAVFEKRFNLAIAADQANRLRLELFPSNLATPALLAAVNKEQLTVIDRTQKKAWSGDLSDELVKEMTGIPINSSQMFSWLSGSVPFVSVREGLERYTYMEEKNGLRSLLILRDSKGFEYVLLFNKISGRIELDQVELSFKGTRKSFTTYARDKNTGVLQGLKLWLLEDGTEIDLQYSDLVVNPYWPEVTADKLFSLRVPRSFQQRPVSELLN